MATKHLAAISMAGLVALIGCGSPPASSRPISAASPSQGVPQRPIDHVIVIYLENRSFDNLYGAFPGAEGLAQAGLLGNPQTGARSRLVAHSSRRTPSRVPVHQHLLQPPAPALGAGLLPTAIFTHEQVQMWDWWSPSLDPRLQ
jgi:phospholipase C